MSTLVIGSSGFLGRRLVRTLAEKGAEPVGFDILPPDPRYAPPGVPFIVGSITEADEIIAAILRHRAKRIVTLAYVLMPQPGDARAIKVNVHGTLNVFEAARITGVDRVVYGSSAAYYGSGRSYGDSLINEESTSRSGGLYQMMKQIDERTADLYTASHGIRIIRIRPSSFLGHGDKLWSQRIASYPAVGKPVHIDFRPDTRVSVVYVDDLAELYARVLLSPHPQHTAYNAAVHLTTFGEIGDAVRKYIPDAQITFKAEGEDDRSYRFDTSRAVTEFDWHPRGVDEAVLATIQEARAEAGLEPARAGRS